MGCTGAGKWLLVGILPSPVVFIPSVPQKGWLFSLSRYVPHQLGISQVNLCSEDFRIIPKTLHSPRHNRLAEVPGDSRGCTSLF